ncbi:hypothetical protein DOTSEDRAFT_72091 [Dothistroma septosporum NZE10]|uniref:Uncharacterized protein n=1 Tax=Dothistroma septosporum (strain NZE10 / CBS 128990) TaxID=675120 RepID=N1PPZ8_DOTSN|nr:hypothetical protein DOTSEDRAFT_72091 [Dothistroma septosporum NZE10]
MATMISRRTVKLRTKQCSPVLFLIRYDQLAYGPFLMASLLQFLGREASVFRRCNYVVEEQNLFRCRDVGCCSRHLHRFHPPPRCAALDLPRWGLRLHAYGAGPDSWTRCSL